MLNDFFKEFPNIFGSRFLINAFLPSLIFWGLIIAVFIAGQGDFISFVKEWNQFDTSLKTLQILAFMIWTIFFSFILSSQFNTILRFYEGYWNFPASNFLASNRKKWHQARLKQLESQNNYDSIYMHYPLPTQPEQVMPTRLGNILKNAELYPFDRYAIDSVLLWPRLYNLFPERFIQNIATAKSSLDFMLVISSLSGIFAVVTCIYLVIFKASGLLFLLCFWGGIIMAWLSYRSALSSAIIYAQQIKAGFDLYRYELLKQMRIELPQTPSDEFELWQKVIQLLYTNDTTVALEYKDNNATN